MRSDFSLKYLYLKSCIVGAEFYHHSPNQFFNLFQRVITRIIRRTFRRYIITSGSPEPVTYRLSLSRILAIRARVGHLKASPYSLTLLLALHQSLISSTIRTFCPILPRLSVGGDRTVPVPVHARGSPQPVYSRRSPGLPSIHSRAVTARASPARSPLVAVSDRSKGGLPLNGVDGSRRTPQMGPMVVEGRLKWRRW